MSKCKECEGYFEGSRWLTTVEIRSSRVNTQVIFPFCSRACRDRFWQTAGDEDLIPFVNSPGTDLPPEVLHLDDRAIALFQLHVDLTKRDRPEWKEVSGHAFEHAGGINTWWRTPPKNDHDLELKPVACSREGGTFHFTEQPPEGWEGEVRLPASKRPRVLMLLLRLWELILRTLGINTRLLKGGSK